MRFQGLVLAVLAILQASSCGLDHHCHMIPRKHRRRSSVNHPMRCRSQNYKDRLHARLRIPRSCPR